MAGEGWDDPLHFPDRAALRAWLAEHHGERDELWVGFYRKATGKGGLGYTEAVDECLCWGWIDGIRKRVDEERYTNRITPRRPDSWWSEKNRARYAELEARGRVAEPGRAARARFQAPEGGAGGGSSDDAVGSHRAGSGSGGASSGASAGSDDDAHPWAPDHLARFREEAEAWAFHRDQPPGYRRTARRWIAAAKRESTRLGRLEKLIRFAAAGERLPEVEGRPTRDEP